MQGRPDLARSHLTFRLWQALQAPPRRFRGGCRLAAAGVVGLDMGENPRKNKDLELSGRFASAMCLGDCDVEKTMWLPQALASAFR